MLTKLQRRCVDISHRMRLSHLSSVLDAVGVIDEIYQEKQPGEPFVLGNAHASLALFVVLEKQGLCNAEEMVATHGTHCCRDPRHGVWVSGGSLGQAETVALGLALGFPDRTVWLVTSDGACMEGCVAESMRIANRHVKNLKATVIWNGRGAYSAIPVADVMCVAKGARMHFASDLNYPEWMRGLQGHYLVLSDAQAEELMT